MAAFLAQVFRAAVCSDLPSKPDIKVQHTILGRCLLLQGKTRATTARTRRMPTAGATAIATARALIFVGSGYAGYTDACLLTRSLARSVEAGQART